MPDFLGHKYWNTCGIGIAIVAVKGGGNDWAAYIGATTDTSREAHAVNTAALEGEKLSMADALHFFPWIELPYRD